MDYRCRLVWIWPKSAGLFWKSVRWKSSFFFDNHVTGSWLSIGMVARKGGGGRQKEVSKKKNNDNKNLNVIKSHAFILRFGLETVSAECFGLCSMFFFRLVQTCSTHVIRSYCWEKSGHTPLESIEKNLSEDTCAWEIFYFDLCLFWWRRIS